MPFAHDMSRLAHIRFGFDRRRRCDVLFLRSGQVTKLEPHLRPHKHVVLEYGSRRIILHPIFVVLLVRHLLSLSTQRAFLKTYVQFYQTPAVIAYDNIIDAWDLADVLDRPMICVQHGMRQVEPLVSPIERVSNVILLSWGELQQDDYIEGRTPRLPNSSFNRRPCQILPIGSLRDSLYRSVGYLGASKCGRLCLVSQFKGASGHGLTMPHERQKNLDTLVDFLNRYACSRELELLVAVYSDTAKELAEEKSWYQKRLSCDFRFTDPSVEFSTYKAVDDCEVTFGVHTSVLWESFGRFRKILACNFTGDSIFDFPLEGPWFLRQASYTEFESRVDELRSIPPDHFQELVGAKAKYMISYSHELPTQFAISNLIGCQVSSSGSV